MASPEQPENKDKHPSASFPFVPGSSGKHRLPPDMGKEASSNPPGTPSAPDEEELPLKLTVGAVTPISDGSSQLSISKYKESPPDPEEEISLEDPPSGEIPNRKGRDPNVDPTAPFQLGDKDPYRHSHSKSDLRIPPPPQDEIPLLAIVGCLGVAAMGAVIWGIVAQLTGMDIFLMALAVGVLVGGTSNLLGGRGRLMGGICCVITLATVLLGRYLAVLVLWQGFALDALAEQRFAQFGHGTDPASLVSEYMGLENDTQFRQFLINRGFSNERSAEHVSVDDVERFLQHNHPVFMAYHGATVRGDTDQLTELTGIDPNYVFMKTFGPVDMVFTLLGLMAAFFLGGGRDGD